MKLTEHFTLEDFIKSETAEDHGLKNTPTLEHAENLKQLCEKVLEPLWTYTGEQVHITSGYRSEALNDLLREHGYKVAKYSQHMRGQAADIVIHGMSNEEIIEAFHDAEIEVDQLIDETTTKASGDIKWIHVSYNAGNNRHKCFKLVNNKGV